MSHTDPLSRFPTFIMTFSNLEDISNERNVQFVKIKIFLEQTETVRGYVCHVLSNILIYHIANILKFRLTEKIEVEGHKVK